MITFVLRCRAWIVPSPPAIALCLAALVVVPGCARVPGGRLSDWWHNGFAVGPNHKPPPGPVADQWQDAHDPRVRSDAQTLAQWWTVFEDPELDTLIQIAYEQNLTLRTAGARILQARAQQGIAVGNLFPQA